MKVDWKYLVGILIIIVAVLISWTMILFFISMILFPIGAFLVAYSKQSNILKIGSILLPLLITFPINIGIIMLFGWIGIG